jgi:hypothetical protein
VSAPSAGVSPLSFSAASGRRRKGAAAAAAGKGQTGTGENAKEKEGIALHNLNTHEGRAKGAPEAHVVEPSVDPPLLACLIV